MLKQKLCNSDAIDGKLTICKCNYDSISSFLSEFSVYETGLHDVCFKVCSNDIIAAIVGHIDNNTLNCRYVAAKPVSCNSLNHILKYVRSVGDVDRI